MTREELLEEIEKERKWLDEAGYNAYNIDMAFDALIKKVKEQEPVLDKISEEMFLEMISHSGTGEEVIQAYADGLKMGLKIIDKYRQGDE